MTDQSMFESNEDPQETPVETSSNPFEEKLKGIKNERGEQKYKDVDTALEALSASQRFIDTLKEEKRVMEEQLNARTQELQRMGNIDDFVKKITTPSENASGKAETNASPDVLSEETIARMLEERLSRRETEARRESNLNVVISKLKELHGDSAAVFIKDRANELGVTVAHMKEMAMDNPNVALSLLSVSTKRNDGKPIPSSNFAPSGNETLEPPKFERGIARGGYSDAELTAMFQRSKEYTYKRLGIKT